MDDITYVGLDVHKATVCVAVAESGRGGEMRQIGVFENRPEILCKLAARLGKGGRRLSFCYEAGPCGYGLHRLLTGRGHSCIVVAPSLIPMKSGDRVKADRRDAVMLAKLHRAGELTAVWIPDTAHEAMRNLVRARATAGRVLAQARQHLQGFLLCHDRIYRGPRAWTLAYRRWLTSVRFDHPAQQIVLQDYIHAVEDAEARRDRLTRQIEELLPSWSMAPVVKALQAMRGVALVVAVTVVAEVGDFGRFANARQLMAYLGLVPSEHSSGSTIRRGAITKAGDALARRVLIEGARTYRMNARVSRKLHDRLEPLPAAIRDIAWKAQVRLCARYRRLAASGKPKVVVTTRDRPRDGRLYLGDRPHRPAGSRLTGCPSTHGNRIGSSQSAGGETSALAMVRRTAILKTGPKSPVDLPLRLDDANASPTIPQGQRQESLLKKKKKSQSSALTTQ